MPGFLLRSTARDQDADRFRFARLVREFDRLNQEIEGESAGLRERYDRACVDAAFTMQVCEAEGDPPDPRRVEEMTHRILQYPARLAELEGQARLLHELRTAIPDEYLGRPDQEAKRRTTPHPRSAVLDIIHSDENRS